MALALLALAACGDAVPPREASRAFQPDLVSEALRVPTRAGATPVSTGPSPSRTVSVRRLPLPSAPAGGLLTAPVVGPTGEHSALVSWYGEGARTANGERFQPDGFTFAHRSMRFGTRVTFCKNGRCVRARCNDRGPAAWTGRQFDLSRGAFAAVAPLSAGIATVTWSIDG